jgi:hypothetical protein
MIKIKEITIKNVWAYLQGNYRYFIWYSFPVYRTKLIRGHILEQVEYRLNSMNKDCYNKGFCKCGCKTINLQFADKTCVDICYPYLVSKMMWEFLKRTKKPVQLNGVYWLLDIKRKLFIKTENHGIQREVDKG